MIASSLLGQTDVFPTFLTPIWLLCVGVTLGMILVGIVCVALFALSRLPVVGTLSENQQLKRPAGFSLALLLLVGLLGLIIPATLLNTDNETSWDGIQQFLLLLLIAIPGSIFAAFALIAMSSKRAVAEIPMAIREGVLYWVTVICCVMAGIAVLGVLLSWVNGFGLFLIVRDPMAKLESYPRTFVTGVKTTDYEIGLYDDRDEVIDVAFNGSELRSLEFRTDQELMLSTQEIDENLPTSMIIRVPVLQEGSVRWNRSMDAGTGPIPDGPVEKLYVRNMGNGTATLQLTTDTRPEDQEVAVISTAAICVLLLYLFYFLQRSAMPKVSAVALSTFKTEIAQPLFLLVVMIGLFFMLMSIYIPYNTFGEDIKMLKDSGLTVILLAGIFMAVWAASKSVADEIEGRTALTVLSKPIGRKEFILGKFLGIAWAIGLLFVILGIGFLLAVAYKPIYDARESSTGDVIWQTCHRETMQIIPGLVLAYLETLVFVAISIAISTRLPMMANFPICLAIYVLGHLTPLMVQSSVAIEAFEGVVFIGQLIATIFPVLDHFNVQAAVAGGTDVPLAYLGYSFIYCMIYGTIAMLLALVMFEDRDLA